MRVHVSQPDGTESVIDWNQFRWMARSHATPQPSGDGGVKVIESVTILSFDDDSRLTFVIGPSGSATSYTLLDTE